MSENGLGENRSQNITTGETSYPTTLYHFFNSSNFFNFSHQINFYHTVTFSQTITVSH